LHLITMPTFEDHFISIDGSTTRYWQAGDRGSPVLLLHGIACSVLEWERNIAALATRHRVFAVDLLGFGLTDKPSGADYSISRLAQFALSFLAAHKLPRTHLAGNSLGGSIALECARIAPERVASQVLVDPAGVDRKGTLLEFRLATIPQLGEASRGRTAWARACFGARPSPTLHRSSPTSRSAPRSRLPVCRAPTRRL
jgi:pimeloyl-ACP methyl ester carboxylesterase